MENVVHEPQKTSRTGGPPVGDALAGASRRERARGGDRSRPSGVGRRAGGRPGRGGARRHADGGPRGRQLPQRQGAGAAVPGRGAAELLRVGEDHAERQERVGSRSGLGGAPRRVRCLGVVAGAPVRLRRLRLAEPRDRDARCRWLEDPHADQHPAVGPAPARGPQRRGVGSALVDVTRPAEPALPDAASDRLWRSGQRGRELHDHPGPLPQPARRVDGLGQCARLRLVSGWSGRGGQRGARGLGRVPGPRPRDLRHQPHSGPRRRRHVTSPSLALAAGPPAGGDRPVAGWLAVDGHGRHDEHRHGLGRRANDGVHVVLPARADARLRACRHRHPRRANDPRLGERRGRTLRRDLVVPLVDGRRTLCALRLQCAADRGCSEQRRQLRQGYPDRRGDLRRSTGRPWSPRQRQPDRRLDASGGDVQPPGA